MPFLVWMVVGALVLLAGEKTFLFRLFNGNHWSSVDKIMPYVTLLGEAAGLVTIFVLALSYRRFRNWWYITAAASCTILAALLTQLLKTLYATPRPLAYFTEAGVVRILPQWHHYYHRSFPSGHTTGAFAAYFLLACLLPEKYKRFGILFFALALTVGYSRIYLAAHFFGDVYAGSVVGTLFSALMLALLRRYQHVFFKNSRSLN